MKELCKIIAKPYVCKECGNEMLFFETIDNYLIDYKKLINMAQTKKDVYDILSENGVKYIKCLVCGKKYIIDWTNGYPEQMMDKSNIQKFWL